VLTSTFYKFWLHDSSTCVGWLHPWVVNTIQWGDAEWIIDHDGRTIRPSVPINTSSEQLISAQNKIIAETLSAAKKEKKLRVLRGWRDELYPIYGSLSGTASVERAGSGLFGILTFGIHLTAYVEGEDGIQIWVPRRAKDKATYPGMLDNTVAGGMGFGEDPLGSIIREATEEASFPEDLVRSGIKAAGTVSYFYIQDPREGEASGLLQPSIRYVFDLKLDANVVPKPGDSEVEGFSLWALDDLKKAVAEGQFRPSSTLVLLDFFIRHSILTAENESDYVEICSRIHRKLPFPISAKAAPAVPDTKKMIIPEAPTPTKQKAGQPPAKTTKTKRAPTPKPKINTKPKTKPKPKTTAAPEAKAKRARSTRKTAPVPAEDSASPAKRARRGV
jgi:isopentenyldiphosphate isomerase